MQEVATWAGDGGAGLYENGWCARYARMCVHAHALMCLCVFQVVQVFRNARVGKAKDIEITIEPRKLVKFGIPTKLFQDIVYNAFSDRSKRIDVEVWKEHESSDKIEEAFATILKKLEEGSKADASLLVV